MKKKFDFNRFPVGVILGLSGPILVMLGFYFFTFGYLSFQGFVIKMISAQIFSSLLSLCVIVNLGIFYIFIQTDRYYAARGVIFSTILYAVIVMILKFTAP